MCVDKHCYSIKGLSKKFYEFTCAVVIVKWLICCIYTYKQEPEFRKLYVIVTREFNSYITSALKMDKWWSLCNSFYIYILVQWLWKLKWFTKSTFIASLSLYFKIKFKKSYNFTNSLNFKWHNIHLVSPFLVFLHQINHIQLVILKRNEVTYRHILFFQTHAISAHTSNAQ